MPLFAAAGLTACATATTAPAATALAGSWKLDKAASDDADATISKVMSVAESRLRKSLERSGYGVQGAGGSSSSGGASAENGAEASDYSFDTAGDRYGGPGRLGPDFRGLRQRLHQVLMPPSLLRLQLQGDLVTISADELPARDYRVGERISRFDEYGTAIITTSWAHAAFVIKSSYTSHASRSDTYQVDAATGALTLTQQIIDPTIGRIVVHSVYHRN